MEYELRVRPFLMGEPKEAALKPLEEAAEAFGAWQELTKEHCHGVSCDECEINWGRYRHEGQHQSYFCSDGGEWRGDLADELADVVQAACNLAARYDIDLASAMKRCEKRNRERGRY